MTGLIYVILIAVWGLVLVPRWLRRHDETRGMSDSEALEAVLSGDRDAGDRDRVEWESSERTTAESEHRDSHDHRAASWGEYLGGIVQVDYDKYADLLKSRGSGLASTVRRRRRILVGLVAAVVVSLTGAVLGLLPGAFMVLFSFLLAGYVSAMVFFKRNDPGARTGNGSDRQQGSGIPAFGREHDAPGVAVDGVRVVGVESDSWDPREATLPTYVTKTKASKIPRRIDLTSGWTGADMVAEAREQQASPELKQQFDREWAAVEPETETQVENYANGRVEGDGYYRRAVNE